MKRNSWFKKLPLLALISALVITAAAWQGQPGKTTPALTDTIPDKKPKNIDDALEQLEKSKLELEKTLQNKDWQKEMKESLDNVHFDVEKMKKELDAQLKTIDVQKMQIEMQKAMKEVDLEKMKAELQENLEKVDMKEMKEQMEKAMKQIDVEKMKSDLDASISKIDMEKIREEMKKVQDIDFKKIEENIQKIKPELEKSMQDAKQSIEKAKKELQEYKNFIDGLDKDGLIDKNKAYTIEYKNGKLLIDGKQQSADVLKKYNEFLKDRKDFTIEKNKDDFNIHNNK